MLTGSAADTNSGSPRVPTPVGPAVVTGINPRHLPDHVVAGRNRVVLPTAGGRCEPSQQRRRPRHGDRVGPPFRSSAAARTVAAGDCWKYARALRGSRQPPRTCKSAGVIPPATCWVAQKRRNTYG